MNGNGTRNGQLEPGRKRRKRRLKIADDFLTALEDGVRRILQDPDARASEVLQAVSAGTRLEAIRHKMNGGEHDPEFFSGLRKPERGGDSSDDGLDEDAA